MLDKTIALLGLIAISCNVAAFEFKTAAQRSAPKYMTLADGSVGGICVDIIMAVQNLDPELTFVGHQNYLPFRRLQRQLEVGDLDVFFGFKKNERRAALFRFVDVPLYRVNYVIAKRSDDAVEIDSLEDLEKIGEHRIGTVRGSAAARFLAGRDRLNVTDLAATPKQLMKMLQAGRIRFAFYHDLGLQHVIDTEGMAEEIAILPQSFSSFPHHVAFRSDISPALFARVAAALKRLNDNGRLREIHRKYAPRTGFSR